MYRRLNKTFLLLTYLSSFLYRFSNPVTLMVVGLWCLISDSGNVNSFPGSGCGPGKIGASICQGHVHPTHLMS